MTKLKLDGLELPPALRDAIAQPGDIVAAWLRAPVKIGCQLPSRPELAPELAGGLIGLALLVDDRQELIAAIRSTRRFDLVAPMIEALVIGRRAGRRLPPRLWSKLDGLFARTRVPPLLVELIVDGCTDPVEAERQAAIRIARRIGPPARQAIAAARPGISKSKVRRLEHAMIALGEPAASDGLLARLLAAWRATHDPALEAPIQRLGEAAARARGPISGKGNTALENAWFAVATRRDPADVDRLLDARWPGLVTDALLRLDALTAIDPDPRISIKLMRIIASWLEPLLHQAAIKLLLRAPTRAIVAALDAFPGDHRFDKVRGAALDMIVRPADPALLDEARAATASSSLLEEMVEAHRRDPGDPGLRAVLADSLQAAGDPRGELIALQTALAAGTARPGARGRIKALIAAHRDEWLRPFPSVALDSVRFERGFVVALGTYAGDRAITAALDRPEWATVEELDAPAVSDALVPLVRRMPLLRVLSGLDADRLARLAAGGPFPSIRALGVDGFCMPSRDGFPNLAVLAVRGHGLSRVGELLGLAAERGLVLVLFASTPILADVLADRHLGPPVLRVMVHVGLAIGSFDAHGWRLELPRGASAATIDFHGEQPRGVEAPTSLLDALAAAAITDVTIDANLETWLEPYVVVAAARHPAMSIRFAPAPIVLSAAPDQRSR